MIASWIINYFWRQNRCPNIKLLFKKCIFIYFKLQLLDSRYKGYYGRCFRLQLLHPLVSVLFSPGRWREETGLAQEARGDDQCPPCGQGGSAPRCQRRQAIGPAATAATGHLGLHPVPALQQEVQRGSRRATHSQVLPHQEQQAIDGVDDEWTACISKSIHVVHVSI